MNPWDLLPLTNQEDRALPPVCHPQDPVTAVPVGRKGGWTAILKCPLDLRPKHDPHPLFNHYETFIFMTSPIDVFGPVNEPFHECVDTGNLTNESNFGFFLIKGLQIYKSRFDAIILQKK